MVLQHLKQCYPLAAFSNSRVVLPQSYVPKRGSTCANNAFPYFEYSELLFSFPLDSFPCSVQSGATLKHARDVLMICRVNCKTHTQLPILPRAAAAMHPTAI